MCLGRYWPYITRQYLAWQMTMEEVNEHMAWVFAFECTDGKEAKRLRRWIVPNAQESLAELSRVGVVKVIRGK